MLQLRSTQCRRHYGFEQPPLDVAEDERPRRQLTQSTSSTRTGVQSAAMCLPAPCGTRQHVCPLRPRGRMQLQVSASSRHTVRVSRPSRPAPSPAESSHPRLPAPAASASRSATLERHVSVESWEEELRNSAPMHRAQGASSIAPWRPRSTTGASPPPCTPDRPSLVQHALDQ